VTATLGVTPFEIGDLPTEIDGEAIEPRRGWLLTQPFNLSGHPAASVPAGFADGLPVGMQVVGPRFDEASVLAASAAVERRRPWRDEYPD
jgi:Asp-tRNA(Asn)/Glu-tRNA(Gln) amidotransferase A subunit family amidase